MSLISPAPRPNRNLALIVSLCLNLVLAGLIAMAAFRFFVLHVPVFPIVTPPGPANQAPPVRKLLSPHVFLQVAPEKADAIHAVLKAHRERIMALKAETSAARRAVMAVFTAPKFDAAAFDQALARMQAADAALGNEALKVTSETSALLSAEERKKVAEMPPPGPPGGWSHRGPPNGP